MNESVTIVLPLPSPHLSPNRPTGSRGSRMRKYRVSQKYRRLAKEATEAAGIVSGPWKHVTVAAVFFHSQRRRRDDINYMAMLKPVYDGVVEASLLVDDDSEHLTTLPARFELDRQCPRVELTFTHIPELAGERF